MFTNYLKSAWRNLLKDKYYALTNIFGLAISITVFLLIINFVKFEYSYEQHIKNADNLYRITLDHYKGSEYIDTDCETYPPLGPFLKNQLPEVVDFTRIQMLEDNNEIQYHNRAFRMEYIYAVDPSTFHLLDIPFVRGNAASFDKPYQAVLTETQAKRIFGNEDPIGKTVKDDDMLLTITGVIKDSPTNTHLKFDFLLSFSTLTALGWSMDNWGGNNNYLYVQLSPGIDWKKFNTKLQTLTKEKLSDKIAKGNRFTAEPIKSIHLYSHKFFEPEVNGDAKTVKFLTIIALLILLVGSINYVNLTTARATERIKEIGMRKLLGSSRSLLITQLMIETLLINVAAMGLALLLIWVSLPFYIQLIGRPITLDFFSSGTFWLTVLALLAFNCLISGIYPAFSLSATKPIKVVGRTFTSNNKGNLFRRSLIVGQFIAAIVVLSATLIVFKQLNFMKKQDLGLDPSEILVIRGPKSGTDSLRNQKGFSFKNSLLQMPEVEKVAISGAVPTILYDVSTSTGVTRYGSDEGKDYNYTLYGIDEDFIPTNGMTLVAGHNFEKGSSNEQKVIINETAARLLGFKKSEDAIGQRITLWQGYTVAGVMKDFRQLSLKEAVLPMIHWYGSASDFFSIKIQTKNIHHSIQTIEKLWKITYPEYPMNYHFMNELVDKQYFADRQFGKVVGAFSIFVLFITCLGILGLTAYNINKRSKEIGIRKVLGATIVEIFKLISFDFVKLILIALCIAAPITWIVMSNWLENYALHIEIQWWIFVFVGFVAILVTLIALSYQSIKAALVNPVKSLRSE